MRVIGISKCWRGQKGTQHHPENLIGECLEAQHSKGESLLNYIYIYLYICILTYYSFILALLAFSFLFQRPLITIWESNTNIFHSHITIFLTFCPSVFQRLLFFFSYLHFSHPTFSLMFCFFTFSLAALWSSYTFWLSLTLSYKNPAPCPGGFTDGSISWMNLFRLQHLTNIFTKSLVASTTKIHLNATTKR